MQNNNPIFKVNCERISRQARYKVSFKFNTQVIGRIKDLPRKQRDYVPEGKYWEVSTKGLYEVIKSYKNSNKIFFDFGEGRIDFLNQIKKIEFEIAEKKRITKELEDNKIFWTKYKEELEENYHDKSELVHKNLKNGIKLFPYQIVGTLFLNEVKNALLSMEMGLGKTIVSIAYVEMNNFEKVFVITPNSLKFNFLNEIEKFTNSKAHIINWKKNKYTLEESKYVIVNYEFFSTKDKSKMDEKFNKLNLGKIDVVIADESHRLKSSKSNSYKNFKRIFKSSLFKKEKKSSVYMSGTPAPNKSLELYTVLNQISPIEFPTKRHFQEYYCGMKYDAGVIGRWVTNPNEMRLEELYKKIAPYTYRKRKQDVLKDLPDKMYQKIIVDLSDSEQKTYNDIEMDVVNEIFEKPTSNPLTIMLRLRQYTSSLKLKHLKEIIDRLLEENEKIVIVDVFKSVLYDIHEMYPNVSAVHTGDQTVEERATIVEKFQDENSNLRIFLGSIQTCNYGLTLTAANKLFIITLPYSVGEYDQVSDRLHRVGQKNTVNIYPIIFKDTLDEYVFYMIEEKRKEIMKVIDNEDYVSNVEDFNINDIINIMKKKYNIK